MDWAPPANCMVWWLYCPVEASEGTLAKAFHTMSCSLETVFMKLLETLNSKHKVAFGEGWCLYM
jgi:hypothetical protein